MSAKAVSEASGKAILNKHLSTANKCRFAVINEETNKLVVKPDQLIKRRGKLGLIEVNVDIARVLEWTKQKSAEVTQSRRCVWTMETEMKGLSRRCVDDGDLDEGVEQE
ncbi:unnamed protein product, partial [Cyprideis torosa]